MSTCIYDEVGAERVVRSETVIYKGEEVDVSEVDYYSILRYICENELGYDEVIEMVEEARADSMQDRLNKLIQEDLGDVDFSTIK